MSEIFRISPRPFPSALKLKTDRKSATDTKASEHADFTSTSDLLVSSSLSNPLPLSAPQARLRRRSRNSRGNGGHCRFRGGIGMEDLFTWTWGCHPALVCNRSRCIALRRAPVLDLPPLMPFGKPHPGDPGLIAQAVRDLILRPGELIVMLLITAITDCDHEIFTTITRARGPPLSRHRTTDVQRIAQSRAENTFHSRMKPFETVNTNNGRSKIPLHLYSTYVALLRSACTDLNPVASVYKHMIRVYVSPNGINEAERIFNDFVTRHRGGHRLDRRVRQPPTARAASTSRSTTILKAHFREGTPERAVESAPADRLLVQTERPLRAVRGHARGPRLDVFAWVQMLNALVLVDRVDLTRMFLVLIDCAIKDRLRVRDADRELVYLANAQRLPEFDDAKAVETDAFLITHVMSPRLDVSWLVRPLWQDFVRRGMLGSQDRQGVSGAVHAVAEHPLTALVVPVEPPHVVRVLQTYAEVLGTNGLPKDMDKRDWAFLLAATTSAGSCHCSEI
ncbi:hypothetical protein B0H11DRAFT_2262779 [Mycena galericulata]|nr:hypothetical protein B0H11DRAFT_2262779 [Mycena galericulata]